MIDKTKNAQLFFCFCFQESKNDAERKATERKGSTAFEEQKSGSNFGASNCWLYFLDMLCWSFYHRKFFCFIMRFLTLPWCSSFRTWLCKLSLQRANAPSLHRFIPLPRAQCSLVCIIICVCVYIYRKASKIRKVVRMCKIYCSWFWSVVCIDACMNFPMCLVN